MVPMSALTARECIWRPRPCPCPIHLQQNGRVTGRYSFRNVQDVEPCAIRSDWLQSRITALYFTLQCAILCLELSGLRCTPHDRYERIVLKRLLDIVESAVIHRRYGTLERSLRRHQNDRYVRILRLGRGQHIEPADSRHAYVRDDDIGLYRRDLIEPLLAAEGDMRGKPLVLEEDSECIYYRGFVIDNEDGRPRLLRFHSRVPVWLSGVRS